jgi:hypothetical protein
MPEKWHELDPHRTDDAHPVQSTFYFFKAPIQMPGTANK